ncbi:hypothetical protein F4779DRAFT_615624 [Xylariaceae sp. FL0662B]|nr:hypothetical protein F4779DRAFT_615624 [Xylariaceae sp. FL0662B]
MIDQIRDVETRSPSPAIQLLARMSTESYTQNNTVFEPSGDLPLTTAQSSTQVIPGSKPPTQSSTAQPNSQADELTLNGKGEQPKKLIENSWKHIIKAAAVHFPPFFLGVSLICINNLGIFWFEMDSNMPIQLTTATFEISTNSILNLLQLAAKVQEALVVYSLSTIALNIYRRLIITDGVPFGMITLSHRVGNINYLKHSGLYNSFSWKRGPFILGSFIIFSTIIALVAGPASAIVLIPSPGWFTMGSDFAKNRPPTWARNWPANGLQGNFTLQGSSTFGSVTRRRMLAACPSNDSATFATTLSSVTELAIGAYYDFTKNNDVGLISHANNVRLRTSPDDLSYQPLVQARCQIFDGDTAAAGHATKSISVPHWPMDGVVCFNDTRCSEWQQRDYQDRFVDPFFWSYEPEQLNRSFHWVETEGPLSAVFNIPYIRHLTNTPGGDWLDDLKNSQQAFYIVTCSFPSRWVPSAASATLAINDVFESNITDPAVFGNKLPDLAATGYSVQLKKTWADMLHATNANTSAFYFGGLSDALGGLLNAFEGCSQYDMNRTLCDFLSPQARIQSSITLPHILERVLGVAIADAMSRVGLTGFWDVQHPVPWTLESLTPEIIAYTALINDGVATPYPNRRYVPPGNESYPSDYIEANPDGSIRKIPQQFTMQQLLDAFRSYKKYDLIVERYGYGSGVSMLLYVYNLARRKPSCWVAGITGWDDIQELVALAWKSNNSSHLHNVGVGVSSFSNVWKQNVLVRVNEKNDLELVSDYGYGDGLRAPERNEYYG